MATQKSLRELLPSKRGYAVNEKEHVRLQQQPEPHTPKRRKVDEELRCPRTPEPVSRGKKLVQMARQKAQQTTPTKSLPVSPARAVTGRRSDRRPRLTARRRLAGLFGETSYDVSAANVSTVEVSAAEVSTDKGPKLQEFGYIEFNSPTKKERASSGISGSDPNSRTRISLDAPLPASYQLLLEKFNSVDTVVSMYQRRKEICTFSKLEKAVEEMTRRRFENRDLAKIKSTYPFAFIFRQEKNIPGDYTNQDYQLIIECNMARGAGTSPSEPQPRFLCPSNLVNRRRVFSRNLYSMVKQHHRDFLSRLDPPLEIPDDKVLRWHRDFPLNSVPEVAEADLPSPPHEVHLLSVEKALATSRRAQLDRKVAASGLGTTSSRGPSSTGPSSTVGTTAAPGPSNTGPSSTGPSNTGPSTVGPGTTAAPGPSNTAGTGTTAAPGPSNTAGTGTTTSRGPAALNGVCPALLDRIRAKEANKAMILITRTPIKEKQLEMFSKFPYLVRIIRGYFLVEKKAVMLWRNVVDKVAESQHSLSADVVEDHLAYLCEVCGGWLSTVVVRKKKYLKMNREMDIKLMLQKLNNKQKQLEL